MAFLTETSNWETGVYQIEIGDAVIGGATNSPPNTANKQLANRTVYLKGQVDNLNQEFSDLSNIVSSNSNSANSSSSLQFFMTFAF